MDAVSETGFLSLVFGGRALSGVSGFEQETIFVCISKDRTIRAVDAFAVSNAIPDDAWKKPQRFTEMLLRAFKIGLPVDPVMQVVMRLA